MSTLKPADFDPRIEFTFFWKDRGAWEGRNLRWRLIRNAWRKQARVVVVTGASAGVGRATVRAFAARRSPRRPDRTRYRRTPCRRARGEELGGKGLAVPADVADADQVEKAAARIESELGPIDVWVNNAMTTVFARSPT